MNQKTVTLPNGEKLVFEWADDLSNLIILKDDEVIGRIKEEEAFRLGRSFVLPDRQQITVIYTEFGLEVWQNGQELVSGATSGSVEAFGQAVSWLQWIGIIQLILTPIRYFANQNTTGIIEAVMTLLIGGFLIGLSLWAKRTGSKTPFWIGIGFGVLNIVLTIMAGSVAGILVMSIMIYYLYKGTKAESPRFERKPFMDPNAPLDSDL
jgi:hypothetical protein